MPQWSAAAALQAAPDPCGGSSLPPRPPKSACAMDRVEPTRTESLRQGWREFRSMRTALILLLALGVAAIFGSLFPQQNISPQRVQQYFDQHPGLAPILDRLGVFDVFGAPWFMAIYLALLTALTACLVPRLTAYLRLVRARPHQPRPRLDHYRNYASFQAAASPEQASEVVRRVLRHRRFRVAGHGSGELSAEKGYLREAGSLVFHVSFLLLLLGLAYGKGFGYRGQATIVEGDTWADARINYDAFTPKLYASRLTALDADGRPTQAQQVTVNRPMTVDGVRVFQSDYGYAPVVRVQSSSGEVLQDGPVLASREPSSEVSNGAIRLPSLKPQVGLQLVMFTGLRQVRLQNGQEQIYNDPRLVNPVLVVLPFKGDLNASQAHSVFTLDFSGLSAAGNPLILPLGKSGKFPDGLRVEFPSLKQYTVLTLASDPGVPIVAVAAGLILAGLIPSLYVTRRRVWLRASPAGEGGVRVELAGLALQGKMAFVDEFKELARDVELGLLGSPSPEVGANL